MLLATPLSADVTFFYGRMPLQRRAATERGGRGPAARDRALDPIAGLALCVGL
jgi:hypothetical protein